MTSLTQAFPPIERRKPRQKNQPKDYGWTLYLIIITVLMLIGFAISRLGLYRPGDKIGYNIGLAGGIMMLTLLLYPIRKRVGFMKNWFILPKWFKWHMIFGILGPALIMFHSTFYIGSINAGVALICMMLVSGSGIFGRFFYTKIHHGLYGRHASLRELQEDLDGTGDVRSIFSFAPKIQKRLEKFRDSAVVSTVGGKIQLWKFMTMGTRAKWHSIWLKWSLKRAMYADVDKNNLSGRQEQQLAALFEENKAFVDTYLATVQQVAQFQTYERLFSLWHLFHVPLIYLLVFSAIWHVIAVHMY